MTLSVLDSLMQLSGDSVRGSYDEANGSMMTKW